MRLNLEYLVGENTLVIYLNLKVDQNNQDIMNSKGTTFLFFMINMCLFIFFIGMCSKCGQKVSGEGTGCTAMEKLFHIKCFLCDKCGEQIFSVYWYSCGSVDLDVHVHVQGVSGMRHFDWFP